jgi:hypothetical protein
MRVQGRTCRQSAACRLYLGAAASAAAGGHAGTSAAAQLRKRLWRLAGIAVRLRALPKRVPCLLCWGLLRTPHFSSSALPKILAAKLPTWAAATAASAGGPWCIPTACLHLCLHATSGETCFAVGEATLASHAPRLYMYTGCHKRPLDTFAAAGALHRAKRQLHARGARFYSLASAAGWLVLTILRRVIVDYCGIARLIV